MKRRKLIWAAAIGLVLLTGCAGPISGVTFSGVSDEDPRVEFETFAKGYTYLEAGNFMAQAAGYDENVIVNTKRI